MKKNVEFNKCEICNSSKWDLIYKGKIRDGYFGKFKDKSSLALCDKCKVVRLSEKDCINYKSYETEEYRVALNQGTKINDFYKIADSLQPIHLLATKNYEFRNKKIADIGCGAGSFLDHIKGLTNSIIAIEPTKIYQESLKSRGFEVFDYVKDALITRKDEVDYAVTFQVIEHVQNPVLFLKEIYKLLRPGGKLLIATPNREDVMLKLLPIEFSAFYYRMVHRWYFNRFSLSYTAKKAGFIIESEDYIHTMRMSNMLNWLLNKTPKGNKINFHGIDTNADNIWKSYLEISGQADTLFLTLSKPFKK